MLLKKKHLFDSKIHYFQVHFIRKRKPENRFFAAGIHRNWTCFRKINICIFQLIFLLAKSLVEKLFQHNYKA